MMKQRRLSCVVTLVSVLTYVPFVWAGCDSAKPNATPADRYVATGETVRDQNTRLIWQRCSLGQRWEDGSGCVGDIKYGSWDEVMKQATAGWRVPTLDELMTLVASHCRNPAINEQIFPGINLQKLWYWTSTEEGLHEARAVNFEDGSHTYTRRTNALAVRLVRDGQ